MIQWEGAGLGRYDSGRDEEINHLFDAVMAGDRVCRAER